MDRGKIAVIPVALFPCRICFGFPKYGYAYVDVRGITAGRKTNTIENSCTGKASLYMDGNVLC